MKKQFPVKGKQEHATSEDDEVTGVDVPGDTPKGKGAAKAGGYKKSMAVDDDDLEKSIALLEGYTLDNDEVSRKDALLSKAQSGDLTGEERDELFKALGGGPVVEDKGPDIVKGLRDNDTLQKALDVSDYLAEQHTELCKSLESVGEVIEQSDKSQHEFNLILAKAVADTGNLVKAIAEQLETISSQPARAPKSVGAQPMAKSFAGVQQSDHLSRTLILQGLDMLMEKSMASGQNGLSADGQDILTAISKYEQLHQISKPMLEQVQSVLRQGAAH